MLSCVCVCVRVRACGNTRCHMVPGRSFRGYVNFVNLPLSVSTSHNLDSCLSVCACVRVCVCVCVCQEYRLTCYDEV